MVEEFSVEMVSPAKRSFWRSGRGIAIIAACLLVLLCALFSWWLSRGAIKSVSARLDTMVYTVEPEFSATIAKILVSPGDVVQSGQALATIDVSSSIANLDNSGMEAGFSSRLNLAMRTERQLASRANQARAEEERLQKIYQDMVTDHVRIQLALRSGRGSSQQLAQMEATARARMGEANAAFEQASRARAALEQELNKIRSQLIRQGVKPETFKEKAPEPVQQQPQIPNQIFAPVNGRIMSVNIRQGETVRQGQTLFVIIPSGQAYISNLWVEAWFPIDDKRSIETGQKALIKFANGVPLEGKVEEISPPVSSQTKGSPVNLGSTASRANPDSAKYLPVRIALTNPADAASISPGAKAECQIQTRYLLGLTWFN